MDTSKKKLGAVVLSSVDGGDIIIHVVYDDNGKMTGVKTDS